VPEIKPADRIIHPRWLVTDSRSHTVREHQSIVIAHGRVIDICPSTVARQFYHAPWIHELPHHLVVPGLINLHTQAATVLFRGLLDDRSLEDWQQRSLRPLERAMVSEEMVRTGVELAMAELLHGGQTWFSDTYFFPDIVGEAALAAGMRCRLNIPISPVETAWSRHADDALRRCLHTMDRFKGNRHISTGFGPQSPNVLSDALLTKIGTLAAENGQSIQMQVQLSATERADSLQRFGQTPIERLDRAGLLTPEFQAVHAIHLTEPECDLLAQRGTHVVHCPIANAKLANGTARIQRLRDAGVRIGLGTASAASHNSLSLLEEAKFASLLGKLSANDARAMTAWTCLEMMTCDAAAILGRADLGHLNPGAEADLAAFPLNAVGTTPLYHPISQLIYANHGLAASDVWIGGELVLRHGRLVHIDEDAAIETANDFVSRQMPSHTM
jgi:5-methylthioadenosine/S-adenosylhomocysteine deaminase